MTHAEHKEPWHPDCPTCRAMTDRAGQLRGVVHTDTPGPGVKRRALITLDLYDFAAWYGKGNE